MTAAPPADSDDRFDARLRAATVPDYELVAPLGTGAFGVVWRARDRSLGRDVALKALHPHIARDAAAVARFREEARVAAQLQHPAIVPVYDWDERAGLTWYTSELAEGGSLADHVAGTGALRVDGIAANVESLLSGVAAAHGAGITHRDIKPENVLIDRWGRWRLSDFGVAGQAHDAGGATGGPLTPAFAAPEQLLREPVGPAADLYAVGAVVWFALTGAPPYPAADAQLLLSAQLRVDLPRGLLPHVVLEWLRRALAPEPSARFPSAVAMLRAWRRTASLVSPSRSVTPLAVPRARDEPRASILGEWRRWLDRVARANGPVRSVIARSRPGRRRSNVLLAPSR
jgi:serine/threonine-protein kinase